MRILILNWKDLRNPTAGGAELLTEGILAELVLRGHQVTLLACAFAGCKPRETINGYQVIRRGKYFTVQLWAVWLWFTEFRKQKFNVVVDQIHGLPFFTPLYMRGVKKVAFIHEVAGDIWYSMFKFPLAQIGHALERGYFWFYKKQTFVTVSNSTKQDLISMGVNKENILIIPEAIHIPATVNGGKAEAVVLYVGRLAPMKQIEQLIEAFAIARKEIPNLALWIVGIGEEAYVEKLKSQAQNLPVTFFGWVSEAKKFELMKAAQVLASASLKEGFGLVIIEAGACGTPSVVYDVPGFRDAIKDQETGLLCEPNPQSLAKNLILVLTNQELRTKLSQAAQNYSQNFTFPKSAENFEQLLIKVN